MSILTRLGWQTRKAHTLSNRRAPAWTPGYARAASQTSNPIDSWSALPEAESYIKAAERYMISDLVFMCVSKLASLGSSSHLALFDPDGERDPLTGLPLESARIKRADHPFYKLWDRPNPFDSRSEFIEATIITLLLSPKGVFTHLDDGRRPPPGQDRVRHVSLKGEPRALWWILPEPMTVNPDEQKFIGGYTFTMAGERTEFSTESIMRITEFHPTNRYNSLSRIIPANLASASDIESQIAGHSLFKNGFRPSAVVESDRDQIDPDEMKLMEKLWHAQQIGSENFNKLFSLWSGFKIKEFGVSPRDAESVAVAKLNRERVFGVFGVHPGLIFSTDTNLASAKVADYATRAWTLAPIMARLAGEITSILPHWTDAPPAEAHFINVVPTDLEAAAKTDQVKAEAANQRSQAITNLTLALGVDSGVIVAQSWGILPEDIGQPAPATASESKNIKAGSVDRRNKLIAVGIGVAKALAEDLRSGKISLAEWTRRMRVEITAIFTAQYTLGFGKEPDRQGKTDLSGMIGEQLQFLSKFAQEIANNPDWSAEMIGARAALYFRSSTTAYEIANIRERVGPNATIKLPEFPGDGNQICLSSCGCGWRIVINADFTEARCFWDLDPSKEHCISCLTNSVRWNPLIVKITVNATNGQLRSAQHVL